MVTVHQVHGLALAECATKIMLLNYSCYNYNRMVNSLSDLIHDESLNLEDDGIAFFGKLVRLIIFNTHSQSSNLRYLTSNWPSLQIILFW